MKQTKTIMHELKPVTDSRLGFPGNYFSDLDVSGRKYFVEIYNVYFNLDYQMPDILHKDENIKESEKNVKSSSILNTD